MSLADIPTKHKQNAVGRPDSGRYLGSITNSSSQTSFTEEKIGTFVLQAAARELAPTSRVRGCLRAMMPGKNEVEVWHNPEGKRAFYRNLMTCSRVWLCPICASKITENRRVELDRILNATQKVVIPDYNDLPVFIDERRFNLAMATLTISHKANEPLRIVLARLLKAYQRTWSGRWASAFKAKHGVIGIIRALEPTHGRNGWHPHLHLLIIRYRQNTDINLSEMQNDLTGRWINKVGAVGGWADGEHGVKVQPGDWGASDYIAKLGQGVIGALKAWNVTSEISKFPAKRGRHGGRTLWDLLAAYVHSDVVAGELWIEAQSALKGKCHLTYPHGLWKALQAETQLEDDELMAQEQSEPGDFILARLTLCEWNAIIKHDKRGELLALAATGDESAVMKFIWGLT